MANFESLRSGGYIQDRRGDVPRPGRDLLESALSMYLAGTGRVAQAAGFYPQKAGILENQLGLGDIPSAGLPAQGVGLLKQMFERTPSPVDTRLRVNGKLWEELTDQEKIGWLWERGFK